MCVYVFNVFFSRLNFRFRFCLVGLLNKGNYQQLYMLYVTYVLCIQLKPKEFSLFFFPLILKMDTDCVWKYSFVRIIALGPEQKTYFIHIWRDQREKKEEVFKLRTLFSSATWKIFFSEKISQTKNETNCWLPIKYVFVILATSEATIFFYFFAENCFVSFSAEFSTLFKNIAYLCYDPFIYWKLSIGCNECNFIFIDRPLLYRI